MSCLLFAVVPLITGAAADTPHSGQEQPAQPAPHSPWDDIIPPEHQDDQDDDRGQDDGRDDDTDHAFEDQEPPEPLGNKVVTGLSSGGAALLFHGLGIPLIAGCSVCVGFVPCIGPPLAVLLNAGLTLTRVAASGFVAYGAAVAPGKRRTPLLPHLVINGVASGLGSLLLPAVGLLAAVFHTVFTGAFLAGVAGLVVLATTGGSVGSDVSVDLVATFFVFFLYFGYVGALILAYLAVFTAAATGLALVLALAGAVIAALGSTLSSALLGRAVVATDPALPVDLFEVDPPGSAAVLAPERPKEPVLDALPDNDSGDSDLVVPPDRDASSMPEDPLVPDPQRPEGAPQPEPGPPQDEPAVVF